MSRIFRRTSKDYRLFASASAFGFAAVLLAVIFSNSGPSTKAAGFAPIQIQHASVRSTRADTVAFAYTSRPITSVPVRAARLLQPAQSLPSTEIVKIGKGDTLNKIFEGFKVPRELSLEAINSLKGVFSPRNFRIGQQITLLFHPNGTGGREFRGYRFAPDPLRDIIIMDSDGSGKFDTKVVQKKLTNVTVAKQGTITGSLLGATTRAGVPHAVVQNMIRVYSFSVDFQRDLKEGDKFEVMYTAKMDENGKIHGAGDMTYAKLTMRGKAYPIYRFQSANGDVDYFKPDGTSNRRGLIRTPINGARMSSGFGMRRHPVLGFSRMHKGVDFAAPTGTPVYAAGDGVILKAGWFSSYGKFIRISHNGALGTAYGHLSRIAGGIRPGVRVKQGQVIGYVGSTGRSTGPHLHYEVLMSGAQINPNNAKVPTANQLVGRDLQKFKLDMASRTNEFRQALARSRNLFASR